MLTFSHTKPSHVSARALLSQAHYLMNGFSTVAHASSNGKSSHVYTLPLDKWLCLQTSFYKSHQRPTWQDFQESLSAMQDRKLFSRHHINLMLTLSHDLLFICFLQLLNCTSISFLTGDALPALPLRQPFGATATMEHDQHSYLIHHFSKSIFVSCRKDLPFLFFVIFKCECRQIHPIYSLFFHFLIYIITSFYFQTHRVSLVSS